MRFSHQESVPVEGCDRRRWPGLQRVVRDFQRGPSEQAPAKRHSALGRLTALTCRDASLARPWTANPGEKTSLYGLMFQRLIDVIAERQRQLRGRRDDAGHPHDGNDTDQHVDDLGGSGTRSHRRIGLLAIGWTSAPDRDQRSQAHQRKRLRIEVSGLGLAGDAFHKAGVVDSKTVQAIRVVHCDSVLSVCVPRTRIRE
jgi:hypothetical protein